MRSTNFARGIAPALLAALVPCMSLYAAESNQVPGKASQYQALPAAVKTLLEAQGKLEAAELVASALSPEQSKTLAGNNTKAKAYINRIYPACRALLAKTTENRVCAALSDSFQTDLIPLVCPDYTNQPVDLAPRYPDNVSYPGGRKPEYGQIPLIDANPLIWATPALWGREPQPPVFSGWKIEGSQISMTENCSALIRSDFIIDDAEVSGEMMVDSGECIYLILRSDIVVKFHPGKTRGSGGNPAVKFGYDNLGSSSAFGKVAEIVSGQWYPFRVVVEGQNLNISFDGKDVLTATIACDPRLKGSKLARAGNFGFGCNHGAGSFKNVLVKALNASAKNRMPRIAPAPVYAPAGAAIKMLECPETNLICLVHNKTEPYNAVRHKVSGGTLFLKGGPYVQFSNKNIAADHFKASGKLKFIEKGSVWFRVNSRLLFGLCSGSSASPFAVKHGTANFNSTDEEYAGLELKPNQAYSWELEYNEPVGTFRLDGNTVMVSLTPTEWDGQKEGPSQFGISSYNTEAEISDLVLQKLSKGGAGEKGLAKSAAELFTSGLGEVEKTIRALKTDATPGARQASAVLAGNAPASAATLEDFVTIAENFRERGNWPTYLSLLEANCQRLAKDSQFKAAAEKTWKEAKGKYDSALAKVEIGDVGLDNVLRVGKKTGPMFRAEDGDDIWISVPATKELLRFDPRASKIVNKVKLELEPAEALIRKDYMLCIVEDDDKAIHKVSLADGKAGADAKLAEGRALGITAHPKKAETFICVDENTKDEVSDFGKFKVYILDEETMQIRATDAIGMSAIVDPLGRYLFTSFHAKWSPNVAVDTAFLRARPIRGHIDHIVRYSLTPAGPVCDGQITAPGMAGFGIAFEPGGSRLCYVSEGGLFDAKTNQFKPFGIGVFKVTGMLPYLGCFSVGSQPAGLEYNPVLPEVYIGTGSQLRRYNRQTLEFIGMVPLPAPVSNGSFTQVLATPDGSGLLVGFSGKSNGVYLHRFGTTRTNDPAKPVLITDPVGTMADASRLITEGKADEGRKLLERLADSFAFTQSGEQAARTLLELDKSSRVGVAALFELTEAETADLPEKVSLDKLSPPGTNKVSEIGVYEYSYKDDRNYQELAEELLSLTPQAREFPYSWLWRCRLAEKMYPESALLKLKSAELLFSVSRETNAASQLAGEVLSLKSRTDWCAARAYSLLADVYASRKDLKREIKALSEALLLCPRDAGFNLRLGEACENAGCPNKAGYHRLLSWHLLPSRPGLAEALSKAGIITGENSLQMDTTSLFRKASPAVVLVGHDEANGTGFIIGRNGLLLTNCHVIEGATDKLTVKIRKGEKATEVSLPARVLAFDSFRDIALLMIDPEGLADIEPLALVDSSEVKTGDPVIAIGNPGFGTRVLSNTATEGIISGLDREVGRQGYFQISAAVNPGNSGGPLLNRAGRVIGMVTLKAQLENVGFAVPSSELLNFILQHEQGEE